MLSDDLHLSPRLTRVLNALENARGRTISHVEVEEAIDAVGQNSVKVAVCQVRKKLRGSGASADIETVWGRGYRLIPKSADDAAQQ